MSLTGLIQKNKPFRDAVKASTRRPVVSRQNAVFIEPRSKRHGLVGTAFDYLVGYRIEHNTPGLIKTKTSLSANKAIQILKQMTRTERDRESVRDAERRIEACEVHASIFVENGYLTPEFVGSLLEVSQLDQIYRAGVLPRLPLSKASRADIEDVFALYGAMPKERFVARRDAYVGPDFGVASQIVGGADADFVIDGTLIDTKTTVKKAITLAMWCQIIGYYLLNRIEKNVGSCFIDIDRIGIYFARYGEFYEVDVVDSIPDPEGLTMVMLGHQSTL